MRWLLWWRPPALLRTVIVNLKNDSDMAVRGVLWQSRGPWLVIRDPAVLRGGQPAEVMDGEIHVLRDNVAFLQVL